MLQQVETPSPASHGISPSYSAGDAFLRANSRKVNIPGKLAWRVQEFLNREKIRSFLETVENNQIQLRKLDETDQPLLKKGLQINAIDMEALELYIDLSAHFAGSPRDTAWHDVLDTTKKTRRILKERLYSTGGKESD